MIAELRKWKLACPKNELGLVFPNKLGNVIHNGTMLEFFFHPAVKKAGIQKIRFHDLRHTYASLLIEQGENIKYISSQLGHSTPTITLEVYAHLLKPTNPEAAQRLESTVFSKTGSRMVAK
jgi:integrase